MRRVSRPKQRLWIISTLLMALFVRALIPAGFMPASDRPFSFQVCPDGFPVALLQHEAAHHHHVDGMLMADQDHSGPAHNHSTASAEHCVFAGAAGVFALAWAATFSAPAAISSAPDVEYLPPAFQSLRFRLPPPRGPPARS